MINRLLFVKVFNYWLRKMHEICNPNINHTKIIHKEIGVWVTFPYKVGLYEPVKCSVTSVIQLHTSFSLLEFHGFASFNGPTERQRDNCQAQ